MKLTTNVLFIDDDEGDQMLFALALKEIDKTINCWYASDGEQALRLVKELAKTPPDVVFLDLNMPRINGKECLTKLREIEWFKAIPIIINSTSVSEQDMRETKELGANSYLTKKYSFNESKNDIISILKRYVPAFTQ